MPALVPKRWHSWSDSFIPALPHPPDYRWNNHIRHVLHYCAALRFSFCSLGRRRFMEKGGKWESVSTPHSHKRHSTRETQSSCSVNSGCADAVCVFMPSSLLFPRRTGGLLIHSVTTPWCHWNKYIREGRQSPLHSSLSFPLWSRMLTSF